jgi:hypothetical protein
MIPVSTTAYSPALRQPAQRAVPDSTPSKTAPIFSTSTPDDAATEKQQQASDALDALRSIAESGPKERKALAEEKLKRLKEEMTRLMQWGFAAGPTAQRSLQIAKELGAAATQFADAVSAQGGPPSSFGSPDPGTSADSAKTNGETDGPDGGRQSALPQAYRDVMDDVPLGKTVSAQDDETISDFRGATQQLTFMLEDSARKLQKDGHSTSFINPGKRSLAGIDSRLAALDGKVAMSAITGTVDTTPISLLL